MADALAITLHALGAESSDGAGAGVDIGARSAVKCTLRVSSVVGSLTASIETSPDNTLWRTLGSFTAVTTAPAVEEDLGFDRCERYVRAKWVLTGSSAAATFSVAGAAHQLFATRGGLGTELPAAALTQAPRSDIANALIKASCDVEDALGARYPLPLTQVPESVAQRCAQIAAYLIIKRNGFAGGGIDELVADSHKQAQQWLKDVRDGKLFPVGVSPEPAETVVPTSGDPLAPDTFAPRFSDNWGDF